MIAGCGFAWMAWRLARSRVAHASPTVRYRILDKAACDVMEFHERYGWVYPVVRL